MTERATGIKTTGADTWVATYEAAEQADGKSRLVQIISLTAGKIDGGLSRLSISANDSLDVTMVSGSLLVGDNAYVACYMYHSQNNGSCLVLPLLCNQEGGVIGYLPPKHSSVQAPVQKDGKFLSTCLSWGIMNSGAWKIYPLIFDISSGNSVDVYAYTF